MCALAIRDDTSPQELRRRARRDGDGRVAARLLAIANALEGMDGASAARLAGMDRQTLRDWVHRYNQAGIAGLSNRVAPGRSPKLTEGQIAALKAVVLAGPDPGGGWGGALAHCRSVPLGGGALGCQLQPDRDAAAVVVIGSVAPQDPAAPSANRREGTASLQKDPTIFRRRSCEKVVPAGSLKRTAASL
jgi:hypothetical protein